MLKQYATLEETTSQDIATKQYTIVEKNPDLPLFCDADFEQSAILFANQDIANKYLGKLNFDLCRPMYFMEGGKIIRFIDDKDVDLVSRYMAIYEKEGFRGEFEALDLSQDDRYLQFTTSNKIIYIDN